MNEIIQFVPIGAENAKSARDIWRGADCWAETTFANKLNRLAAANEILRRQESTPSGFRWVYWRAA